MKLPLVINIQKYSIHDGNGIRTAIFFKGCPLKCAWCHNPESQHYYKEVTHFREKCVQCLRCVRACPEGVIRIRDGRIEAGGEGCVKCGACERACLSSAIELSGREYTVDELVREAEQDRMFYEESGGGGKIHIISR